MQGETLGARLVKAWEHDIGIVQHNLIPRFMHKSLGMRLCTNKYDPTPLSHEEELRKCSLITSLLNFLTRGWSWNGTMNTLYLQVYPPMDELLAHLGTKIHYTPRPDSKL